MMKRNQRILSLLLVMVLTATVLLTCVACDKNKNDEADTTVTADTLTDADTGTRDSGETKKQTTVSVTVVDNEGKSTVYSISTESDNLRGALDEEHLVEGEEGEFGLYIKVVNGLRADFDKDGAYWKITKGGEYLMTGVDTTPIADGDSFELTYTKA